MQTENTDHLEVENHSELTDSADFEPTHETHEHPAENIVDQHEDAATEDIIEELSAEEKYKLELAEMKDKYIRMYSEFENFRRRTAKEKVELIQNASQNLLKELLPVVDDFERAQTSFETVTEIEAVKEGVGLVFNKLQGILKRQGLTPMEAKDTVFDVELHECITQIDTPDELKGKVVDVIEKGFLLNDKVIRYAKVVVGK